MWVAESSGRRFRMTSRTAGSGSGSRLGRRRRGVATGHCVPGQRCRPPRERPRRTTRRGRGSASAATSPTVELTSSEEASTDAASATNSIFRWRSRASSAVDGLRGSKLLRLVLRRLPLADVEQIPLDAERPARLVQHRDGLLPHPDDTPVAREHAVAQADGLRRVHGVPLGEDLVPVVRVDEPGEEAGISEPLVGGVADEPVDLRADERRLPALEGPDVGDERQVLPERAVGRLGVAKLAREPSHLADVSGDDDRLGRVRDRDRRDRGGEDVAFTAPLLPDLVQPLAFADGFGDTVRLVIPEQVGEWAADDLVGFVAVQLLGAGAPARDDAVGVDAQDRVGRGGLDCVQPALGESLVSRPLTPADRQPSDRGAGDEPEGKRDQPGAGLVRDEEVVQQPANSGCGDRNGEHDDPRPSQVRGALSGLRDAAHKSSMSEWLLSRACRESLASLRVDPNHRR